MSEQQTTEEKLLGRLRETSLRERIEIAQAMIGHMCKDGRPPKMSIPVQYADEDFYITNTLADAAARIKELEAEIALHHRKDRGKTRDLNLLTNENRLYRNALKRALSILNVAVHGGDFDEAEKVIRQALECKWNSPEIFKPGDHVIYIPGHAGGDPNHPECERGVVTSTNDKNVFVRFGTVNSQACDPGDLVHAGKGGEDADNR